jgi:hypothetical protein
LAALAGAAKQMIAEAADSAKAQIRLPIMGDLIRVLYCSSIRAFPAARPVEIQNSVALVTVSKTGSRSLPETRAVSNPLLGPHRGANP